MSAAVTLLASLGCQTDLAEDSRVQPCLLEEFDGNLARHDADILRVGLSEELTIHSFLLRGEVQVRRAWEWVTRKRQSAKLRRRWGLVRGGRRGEDTLSRESWRPHRSSQQEKKLTCVDRRVGGGHCDRGRHPLHKTENEGVDLRRRMVRERVFGLPPVRAGTARRHDAGSTAIKGGRSTRC